MSDEMILVPKAFLEKVAQDVGSIGLPKMQMAINAIIDQPKPNIFQPEFACGDKAWVFVNDYSQQLTIGRVEVVDTNSPGLPGESIFSNYGPQRSYEERYMCVGTGVGSGSVYTFNEHIFHTKAECDAANAKAIAEREAARHQMKVEERRNLLREESSLRERLANIEAMKLERTP